MPLQSLLPDTDYSVSSRNQTVQNNVVIWAVSFAQVFSEGVRVIWQNKGMYYETDIMCQQGINMWINMGTSRWSI